METKEEKKELIGEKIISSMSFMLKLRRIYNEIMPNASANDVRKIMTLTFS